MINYLILYKRNGVTPIALVEFHTSIGNPKVRNLKWLKDEMKLATSNKLASDLKYLGIRGYVSRVSDLGKLPRTNTGSIELEYRPVRVTTDDIKAYLIDQKLIVKSRGY